MVNKPKRLKGLVQKDKARDWRIKGRPVSPPTNPAESMSPKAVENELSERSNHRLALIVGRYDEQVSKPQATKGRIV